MSWCFWERNDILNMIQYMFGSKKYHCWLVVVDYFIKEITLMNRLQETIKINKTFTLKSITVTLLWFISIRKAFLMHCTFSMRLSILWQRIQTWPYEKCTCRKPKRRDGQMRMSHVCHTPTPQPLPSCLTLSVCCLNVSSVET